MLVPSVVMNFFLAVPVGVTGTTSESQGRLEPGRRVALMVSSRRWGVSVTQNVVRAVILLRIDNNCPLPGYSVSREFVGKTNLVLWNLMFRSPTNFWTLGHLG